MRKMPMISAIVIPSYLFLGGTKHAGSSSPDVLITQDQIIEMEEPNPYRVIGGDYAQ